MTERIAEVRRRIDEAAKRVAAKEVTLIAVSKTKPVEAIREAQACGVTEFGENYVNEALAKSEALAGTPFHLHFIGHLQTNKAGRIVPAARLIHSVDSLHLAAGIDKQARKAGIVSSVLLEVNISGEASKFGFEPSGVLDAAKRLADECPGLRICGLMGMAPFLEDPEGTRPYFASLKKLYDALDPSQQIWLSMGMSGDYVQAIEEGSNMVRVGTAIFGSRDHNK
ncbi:MAG: YggS family pyridoxal phosphate-dependent enzyme [Abditibacteriota bacterium]|nr:YggS family pyridoxal phosphate-dependent enzyme [Abditibacteriota bacterium]